MLIAPGSTDTVRNGSGLEIKTNYSSAVLGLRDFMGASRT